MATPLTVGKARLFSITLHNPDGSVNTAATPSVSSGNSTTMRATLNPSNPREGAIVGVAPSSGVNVIVSAPVGPSGGTKSSSSLITVNAATVDMSDVQLGAFGDEIDPPSWA
ncbi:MAG TPA: hypothetical protein VJZ73_13345 [Methylomirabilota bacterium]|nr:hypothetical protein [Methylomirabilota bacterium]